jgi:hypothetical protein
MQGQKRPREVLGHNRQWPGKDSRRDIPTIKQERWSLDRKYYHLSYSKFKLLIIKSCIEIQRWRSTDTVTVTSINRPHNLHRIIMTASDALLMAPRKFFCVISAAIKIFSLINAAQKPSVLPMWSRYTGYSNSFLRATTTMYQPAVSNLFRSSAQNHKWWYPQTLIMFYLHVKGWSGPSSMPPRVHSAWKRLGKLRT